MLTIYSVEDGKVLAQVMQGKWKLTSSAVWIDLLSPTDDELDEMQSSLGIDPPTSEEMSDIEVSSRLYNEHGAVYMIGSALERTDSDHPRIGGVTFIVTKKLLVTVRYEQTHAFETFVQRARRNSSVLANPDIAFVNLVEAHIDRLGSVLKRISSELEPVSQKLFKSKAKPKAFWQRENTLNLKETLRQIGLAGRLSSQVHDSLVSFKRLMVFYRDTVQTDSSNALNPRIDVILKDVDSLNDHVGYLTHKVNFYLDGALGMVNAEQNQIIKIFSVAAVIFLPPTLVASIYGMNFTHMPELAVTYGYPIALLLMTFAAIVPYLYFRRKGWI